MAAVAVSVFVVAYILIASDRINKTLVALCGGAIVLVLGIIKADDAFYSHETGIDWNVIFLLFGMMIIVGVLRRGDQVLVVAALDQVAQVEDRLRSVSRYGRLAGWAEDADVRDGPGRSARAFGVPRRIA